MRGMRGHSGAMVTLEGLHMHALCGLCLQDALSQAGAARFCGCSVETSIFLPGGFHQTLRRCFADYGLGLMNIITILFQHNKENLVIINSQKPVYLFT